ncbi:MAG TPA: translation initiation factor IF-2 [Flavobacteriia bacterium]|nr:translation initiation factor IF-2 [Flavobacteriia bacterium]
MAKQTRLNKVLKEFNISLERAVDYLATKNIDVDANPNTKITQDIYDILSQEFQSDKSRKATSREVSEEIKKEKEAIRLALEKEREEKRLAAEKEKAKQNELFKTESEKITGLKQVGKIDLDAKKEERKEPEKVSENQPIEKETEEPKVEPVKAPKLAGLKKVAKIDIENNTTKKSKSTPNKDKVKSDVKKDAAATTKTEVSNKTTAKKVVEEEVKEPETIQTQYKKLKGFKTVGEKIDLDQFKTKKKEKKTDAKTTPANKRPKRKRINKPGIKPGAKAGDSKFNKTRNANNKGKGRGRKAVVKEEPTEEEIQKQVRETLERLQGKSKKGKGAKYRKSKRDLHKQQTEKDIQKQEQESKILKVTEFVTVNEIATMMNVSVTQIISACMSLGMMVTMNQRLDAETLSIVADEFGYEVEFVDAEVTEVEEEEIDNEEDLQPRAPIVTVMGHVDHGKTSLLDYIRKENVIAGESGGITQHIGAYSVALENGEKITFLDTPGHEAFTAMRARGTQVTDVVVIVIAADDSIMPQTKEAISHAQAAGVPIIFAINKIDKPGANPDKVKEELAQLNLLVEDWGGKVQSQDISAKFGTGVNELLEKVLLETEMLDLKANPNKKASGTVVEAQLDKGRGYVTTLIVQTGTLKVGDYLLAGTQSGKVKAMLNERGDRIKEAGPSTPVSILGLDGAPQAGDKFKVYEDEREAKDIATKREQLLREQNVRTQKHITLDEIGRRIALGNFKELNIILKGDVDGSVEALTDSLQKLSTEEIQINIIHKGVGAITESDVLLASASDAIIIGFNVRPQGKAANLAQQEGIDIRTYSIIYKVIDDVKDAMEGMLSPDIVEEITGTAEVRETYKISKIGTIAGCMVLTGKIFSKSKVRLIRDNVVIYTGELASLKRFKDDVKEVAKGYDCGMQIKNYNDLQINDIIEAYQEKEVKKKLK